MSADQAWLSAMQQLPAALGVVRDGDGVFTFVNPALRKVLGDAASEGSIFAWLADAEPLLVGAREAGTRVVELRHLARGQTELSRVQFTQLDAERWLVMVHPAISATAQDRFQSLWEASPLSMSRFDRRGYLVAVNDALIKLYGLDATALDAVVGKVNLRECAQMLGGPARLAQVDRALGQGVVEQLAPVCLEPSKLVGNQVQSTPRWVASTVFPLVMANGEFQEIVVVDMDLTDQHRFEQQMLELQKLEAVGQLAAGVAHEFNNLLTVMLGHLSFIEAEADLDATSRESMQLAMHAADEAGVLTRKLLTFARQQPASMAPVQAGRMADESMALVRRAIDTRISLDVEVDPEVHQLRLEADPAQLQQSLINLLLNAADAMAPLLSGAKREDLFIKLRVEQELTVPPGGWQQGAFVVFSVVDNGPGMSETVLERAFEPFFTTKPPGKGSGLGLSVAYGMARRHGGFATARSSVPGGSTISLHMPAVPRVEVQAASGAQKGVARSPLVLIVDDESEILDIYEEGLAGEGFRVMVAPDALVAESLLAKHASEVQVLVMDLSMPRRNGRDLLRRVRPLDLGIKVIVVSGRFVKGDAALLKELGAVALLQKPVSVGELARTVRAVLAGQPAVS